MSPVGIIPTGGLDAANVLRRQCGHRGLCSAVILLSETDRGEIVSKSANLDEKTDSPRLLEPKMVPDRAEQGPWWREVAAEPEAQEIGYFFGIVGFRLDINSGKTKITVV